MKNFDSNLHLHHNTDTFFYWLCWLGFAGIILPLPVVYFYPQLSAEARGELFILPLLGLWFVLEYVEHDYHKKSFLFDLFSLKLGKILAVLGTSVLIGLAIEGINLFMPVWQYKNFPFSNIYIFHIPVIVLVAWVPFILLYLSFDEIFLKKDEAIF